MLLTAKPSHYLQEFAGTVQNWCSTDSEQQFRAHMSHPQQSQQLQKLGWTADSITYSYNSEGFRDREFDVRPAGIALGCSHTQGVGLGADSTWPSQLAQMTNTHIWNLGISGAALDTCYRILDYWIQHLNTKFVVCLVPDAARYEIFDRNWTNILPVMESFPEWLKSYQKNWIAFEENAILAQRKNLQAMQYICIQHGVSFFYEFYDPNKFADAANANARDLLHCGHTVHTQIAGEFYQQYKNTSIQL